MAFVDDIKKHAFSLKVSRESKISVDSFNEFIEAHSDFVQNHYQSFVSSIQKAQKPSSEEVQLLFSLYSRVISISYNLAGSYFDPIYLEVADFIADLKDNYTSLVNAYYMLGFADSSGYSNNTNYTQFTIPKGMSLSEVSQKFYDTTQRVNDILSANPELRNLSPSDYWLKTILIPVDNLQKASISTNIGEASWGADLPLSLTTTPDGDLEVLSYKDSFIQDILNIAKYSTCSVPEDTSIGNAFIDDIGESYAGVNITVASGMLVSSLLSDIAVESVVVDEISIDKDAIKGKIIVKPINSDEVFDITL